MAAALTLSLLDVDEQSGSPTTIGALAAGKPLVLDFWHTRCVNCPAALSKLDGEAEAHPEVVFAACALSRRRGDDVRKSGRGAVFFCS